MHYQISIFKNTDLEKALASKFEYFIIHIKNFSKQGEITFSTLAEYYQKFKQQQKKLSLQIDMPVFDHQIDEIVFQITKLEKKNLSLRIENIGLARAIKEKFANIKIQLILLNHAKTAEAWLVLAKYFKDNLERLVVSSEIPFDDLKTQTDILKKYKNIPIEIMGAGRIMLFFSLRDIPDEYDQKPLHQTQKPGVAPMRIFKHQDGFGIYHGQDLFILDLDKQIQHSRVDILRIDPYLNEHWQIITQDNALSPNWELQLKKNWQTSTSYGFFLKNRTDLPFKLLKNRNTGFINQATLGEVIEYVRYSHMVVRFDRKIKLPCRVKIITPEGFKLEENLKEAKNLLTGQLNTDINPGYYLIPPIKRAITKSVLLD